MHGTLDDPAQADPRASLRAARAARSAGDPAGAARHFATHIAANPHDLRARLDHGWACWSAGDRAAAEAIWTAAHNLDPRAAEPRLVLAHAHRARGDGATADSLVAAVLADHPGHPRALAEYALLLRARGDLPGSEAAARAALAGSPGDPRALIELGRTARARGAVQDALAAFRAAQAGPKGHAGAMAEEARTLLAAQDHAAALALLADAPPADRALALLVADALRGLGRRREARAHLTPHAGHDRRAAWQAAIDTSVLDRPARFLTGAPPGPGETGADLAAALSGATAEQIAQALSQATYRAHPFLAIGAARRLRGTRTDAPSRLALAMAEATALTTVQMTNTAAQVLDAFAAEGMVQDPAAAGRLALRRAHMALATGDRPAAARHFLAAGDSPARLADAAAWCAMIDMHPAEPSAEACRALLAGGIDDPRLAAWLIDRAATIPGTLPALPRDTPGAMRLLRHNLALADGRIAEARALLAEHFAEHGIACPQPEGAPAGIAHFAMPPLPAQEGPLVSVVVSAFEAEATLAVALRSILAQSWRTIEVIVVDDASTDGTGAVIEAFAAQDPRLRPLRNRRNAGTYASRNRAIAAARGAFITFHDADDWMHPARLATQMAVLRDPQVQAVNAGALRLDAAGRARFRPRATPGYANPSFMLIRTEALRRLGAYDHVRFSADTEMWWRARLVLGQDAMVVLPGILTVGLSRPGSLTTATATGFDLFDHCAPRAAYNEAWTAWHLACDARGEVPHLAAEGPPRPYLASLPEGTAAGAAC